MHRDIGEKGMAGVAKPSFTSVITLDKHNYKSGKNIKLLFKVTNDNDCDMYVLKWHTPLEGFRSSFLEVKLEGNDLAYMGLRSKRGDPSEDSYELIPAGESVQADVVLNNVYDLSESGHYTVELKTKLMDVIERQQGGKLVPRKLGFTELVNLTCDPVHFNIVG